MQEVNTHWLAWAAGIIDGEGCIRLARNKRKDRPNDTFTAMVFVVNTDIRMLLKLREILGGDVVSRPAPRNPNHKPQWRWQVFSGKSLFVLEQVLPWLVAKKEQAELVLSSTQYRGNVKRDSSNVIELQRISTEMSLLKRQHQSYATH